MDLRQLLRHRTGGNSDTEGARFGHEMGTESPGQANMDRDRTGAPDGKVQVRRPLADPPGRGETLRP
jgi:hypothetical protein